MRQLLRAAAVLTAALAVPASAAAQDQQLQGFGALTFGDVTRSSSFGGSVSIPLTDTVHVLAEGGRVRDLTRPLLGTLVDLTPYDLRVSAWYGEGGVRLIAPSSRAVRPYAEATGGFARVSTGFTGLGDRVDPLVNAALSLLDRTEPMLGVGGGVLLQGGPVFVDLGYRYKKILGLGVVPSLLTGGDVNVSQARVGIGVRF